MKYNIVSALLRNVLNKRFLADLTYLFYYKKHLLTCIKKILSEIRLVRRCICHDVIFAARYMPVPFYNEPVPLTNDVKENETGMNTLRVQR